MEKTYIMVYGEGIISVKPDRLMHTPDGYTYREPGMDLQFQNFRCTKDFTEAEIKTIESSHHFGQMFFDISNPKHKDRISSIFKAASKATSTSTIEVTNPEDLDKLKAQESKVIDGPATSISGKRG